jgi:predicted lipoprotein with Yx(FWY)xxD motif
MRPTMKILIPAVVASLAIAACGSSSKGSSSSSSATAAASSSPAPTTAAATSEAPSLIKTASNATLGATVLTDAHGMTLYRLSGEHAGKFICTSAGCVGVWHPVSVSAGASPTGSVGSLGTVKRPDGTEQVTYKGMPLYTFAQDQQPGDAKGQGLKDVGTWTAVTTSAASTSAASTGQSPPAPAATQTSPPAESSTPAKSGGSYGY